jgi:hypothetical protein
MNAQGRLPLGWCGLIKSTLLEGRAAPSPWWWCLLVICVVVDGLVTSQAHCMKKWYKNNLKMRLMALLFDPPRCAPHQQLLALQVNNSDN